MLNAPVRTSPFPVEVPPAPASDSDPLAAFEGELATFLGGTARVIACDGHEAALELGLRLALQGHDQTQIEVVVPTLGAERAARTAMRLGARVVPVDVEQDTGNLAPRALASAIGPWTRVVLVSHLSGHPATMPELLRLAEHHSLTLVEDVSEALGAAHSGVAVGASGTIAVLGGGASHLLTADGIGAILVPASESEAQALVRGWRDAEARAPEEATVRLALAELRGAEHSLHVRSQAAWHLTYELRAVRGVSPMFHGRRVRHGYDRYTVRLRSVLWHRGVEESAAALSAEGIPTSVASGALLHEDVDVQAQLSDDPRIEAGRFSVATQLASELVAIPLNNAVTSRDMDDVAAAIRKVETSIGRDTLELAR